jgi:hypothetical protein
MSKLVGACALVATATLASAASAATPPGTFNFAFPLPALGHGSIYEVVLKFKLPAGATVSGTPFVFHVANGSTVPGYIRAAYGVVAKASDTWDIFVGINAPTSTKGRRLSSSSTATFNATLQANPVTGATTTASEPSKTDACKKWRDAATAAAFFIMIGGSDAEAKEIMDTYIEKDDSHCE